MAGSPKWIKGHLEEIRHSSSYYLGGYQRPHYKKGIRTSETRIGLVVCWGHHARFEPRNISIGSFPHDGYQSFHCS